jgi:hypothetical protein
MGRGCAPFYTSIRRTRPERAKRIAITHSWPVGVGDVGASGALARFGRAATDMDQKSAKNRLLQVMLPDDFERLSPGLEPVPLARSQVLVEPEVEFDHAYFFERGIGSVVTISPEGLEA